jgi:hypothetical protein
MNACRTGFFFIQPSRETVLSCNSPLPPALSFTELLLPFHRAPSRFRTLNRLSMGPAARDNRGVLSLSIVGWFCPLPWLASVAGNVAPDVRHLVLAAVGVLLAALREDGQNDSRRATTPVGRVRVETAEPSPMCGVRGLPLHVGRSDSSAQYTRCSVVQKSPIPVKRL